MTVRFIAFYLPQFHPTPDNDAWWGPGFTEWTITDAARPLFAGHDQPHRPAELGRYDLRDPGVRAAQAELARRHGIDAFCYYHYWFEGRRLLERPFREVLASGAPDLPFCLCWSNESWTRRFDGKHRHLLLAQTYSERDDREHIRWLSRAFQDPRYLRVDGRPIFLVYRARSLPAPRRTTAIWREEAARLGIGELFLGAVESNFRPERAGDPRSLGFDAAVEFQPDAFTPTVSSSLRLALTPGGARAVLRCALRLSRLRAYRDLAAAAIARPDPGYPRLRCVTPSWDNTARRPRGRALIYTGSTPALYEAWLGAVGRRVAAGPEPRLLFINAWNEWGEGCHLEPDQRHGRGYLEATLRVKRALTGAGPAATGRPAGRGPAGYSPGCMKG